MNENENENVSRETEDTETVVIDYSQDIQAIKDTMQSFASPISSMTMQLEYNNILLEQINSQMNYSYNVAFFSFVLVMFEVFRFVKGLLKGVFKDE